MTAPASGILNAPFIGVNNFHVAELLTDPDSGEATYSEIVSFPWLRSVQIEPTNAEATLYADNKSVAAANAVSEYTLTIETATMPLEYKAWLLGHTYDELTGIMTVTSEDAPPYFAIMFESTKQNGKKRFVKFVKVQFAEPSETSQTKEENISFHTPSLKATAIYRNDGVCLKQADEEASGYEAATGTGWYAAV